MPIKKSTLKILLTQKKINIAFRYLTTLADYHTEKKWLVLKKEDNLAGTTNMVSKVLIKIKYSSPWNYLLCSNNGIKFLRKYFKTIWN